MIFIFDEKISEKKRVDISLKECLGLGKTYSFKIYVNLGLSVKKFYNFKNFPSYFSKNIDENVYQKVFFLNNFVVGSEQKNLCDNFIKLLKESNCYRWRRHFQKLPVRAQHTRTNARTQKSKRGFRRALPIASKKKLL